MGHVLLVNMPFFHVRWPNLGLGLLAAALKRRGIGCRVAYLNFDLAERVGLESYLWIAEQFAFVLGGERLFAQHYFGPRLPDDARYWREVLLPADPALEETDRQEFARLGHCVGPFLDACLEAVDWQRYDVVGFAASFQQTMAAMCLARRIKQLRPQTTIVLGGAACEDQMGLELLHWFPEVDFVFSGEADLAFPVLAERLLAGRPLEPLPPGVIGRPGREVPRWPTSGQSLPASLPSAAQFGSPGPAPHLPAPQSPGRRGSATVALVEDLDALPYPDFDDYFARLQRSGLREQIEPLLFFETSRGCWWGQKHHCLFCGLNGARLTFRSKSPARALEEMRYLAGRYGVRRMCWADNILDPRYFRSLLPMLKEAALGVKFECEMRTSLRWEEARLLIDAGLGAAQLGIETFASELLQLAGKGTTAIDNLQALKWFSAAGIEVKWNLLYGFPGEEPRHYAALAELLPSLYHLAPPQAVGRVRLDRFSPYFDEPESYGLAAVRPQRGFAFVYPFPADALARLAYYFEYDYSDGRKPEECAQDLLRAARQWQQLAGTVSLRYWDRPDGVLLVTDTRPGAKRLQRRLSGWQRELYLYCDPARSRAEVCEFAAGQMTPPRPDEPQITAALDEWVRARIMACLDGRYLSLALRAES